MFDLIIRNGRIIDGTGSPWLSADLGVSGNRIAAVGRLDASTAKNVMDATDRFVAPGFIDIHTHSDLSLLVDARAISTLSQGVTTQIVGNCGMSAAPTRDFQIYYGFLDPAMTDGLICDWLTMADYFARLEASGVGTNVYSLLGHGNLRTAVLGFENRDSTRAEKKRMCDLAAVAMEEGAIGLSTGLAYLPGTYANIEELVEVAKVIAEYGGIHTSHIRNQTSSIDEAVEEIIEISRQSGVRGHVSHMQPGPPMHGHAPHLLERIRTQRNLGLDLSCDAVPYTVGSTTLKSMLPPWAGEGGQEELMRRLADPEVRAQIKDDTMTHGAESGGSRKRTLIKEGRWDLIWLASAKRNPSLAGKSFKEIAILRNQDPHDALLDLLLEEEGQPWMLGQDVSEEDFIDVVTHPLGGIISDGFSLCPEGQLGRGNHHPRSYGAFTRFLRVFVRERGLISWETAIHKMTGFAASRFRIPDRGLIREGHFADLVIFNPDEISEKSTFDAPYQLSVGVDHVYVNGVMAWDHGELCGQLSGMVCRRAH